jgi:sugar/nucleoside kinase (ribokinase family)
MDFWMNTTWDLLMQVISKVDVITINDAEARQLSGEFSLVKAAQKIWEMGPKVVVIKKGEHGALLFKEHQIFFAPALPLEDVFDPTGAGDTFAGGFTGYLAHTGNLSYENMKKAIIVGSTLASFTVEKFGTEKLQELGTNEYDFRLKEFKNLTEYNYNI